MATMAKPRTGAFILDSKKSKEFFANKENTADKAIARAMDHRIKAGVVDSRKNGKSL